MKLHQTGNYRLLLSSGLAASLSLGVAFSAQAQFVALPDTENALREQLRQARQEMYDTFEMAALAAAEPATAERLQSLQTERSTLVAQMPTLKQVGDGTGLRAVKHSLRENRRETKQLLATITAANPSLSELQPNMWVVRQRVILSEVQSVAPGLAGELQTLYADENSLRAELHAQYADPTPDLAIIAIARSELIANKEASSSLISTAANENQALTGVAALVGELIKPASPLTPSKEIQPAGKVEGSNAQAESPQDDKRRPRQRRRGR